MEKKVTKLYETLCKFIQRKEKFDLILSSKRSSLNKNGIGFNKVREPSKCSDHKKKNRLVYKCTQYKIFDHL